MSSPRQYELVYIVTPEATEETLADLHQQVAGIVERFGGTIERTEPWGRRKLAYDIGGHREGIYVMEVLNGPGEMTAELDRRLRVFDAILRHLLVRVDEELAVADRTRTRRKAEVAARRTRRGLPPEPTESELVRRHQHDRDEDEAEPEHAEGE